jgi:hypothetical protein
MAGTHSRGDSDDGDSRDESKASHAGEHARAPAAPRVAPVGYPACSAVDCGTSGAKRAQRAPAPAHAQRVVRMTPYQRGKRDGYADGKAGKPWPNDGAPGSSYSAGYREGRQNAALERYALAV